MALDVTDIVAQPTIANGSAAVHSGRARVARAGMAMVKRGEPAAPFAFYVPDARPLGPGDPVPDAVAAEAWLMLCRTAHSGNVIGVEHVSAAYEPDPRNPTRRWLLVSGTAHAGFPITIGYRVTVPLPVTPAP